ncbi:MAG: PTS galactitol transporter subunit IIC [Denitrovibrio sp.]|nr:MAG: PTS galactitol transporter subunit IIC [Denitrovibrio sp.]
MELSEHIDENSILNVTSDTKEGVLKELVDTLVKNGKINNPEVALSALLEREALGSTGVGEQVAIPHAKMKELDDVAILVGICKEGIEFGSSDGAPVRIFFLLLAPEKQMNLHLKTLARISRLIKLTDFKNKVLEGEMTTSDISKVLKEEEARL